MYATILCGRCETLSIVVPAYNEAAAISSTIREIQHTLESRGQDYEVIVVDDGSRDGTLAEASAVASANACVRVVSYGDNHGKGHALKHGFGFARGDLVLFFDADSDLPATQIPQFLGYMKEGDIDIVIGSKTHALSSVSYPLSRRFFSMMYGLLVRVLFSLRVSDTQTGMKLFRKEVLERVFPKVLVKRYAFDLELLVNARRLGYHIQEAPVIVNYRFESRINPKDVWRIFLDTMAIFYRARVLHFYDRKTSRS